MKALQPSNYVLTLIKKFEGFSSKAYLCPSKVPTIGYGFTKGVQLGDVMTMEQADERLKAEVKDFAKGLNSALMSFDINVNQNQFDALLSFAYNVGLDSLLNSTLFKKLTKGDYKGASDEFGKWVYSNHVKLNGLVARRKAEKELFNS